MVPKSLLLAGLILCSGLAFAQPGAKTEESAQTEPAALPEMTEVKIDPHGAPEPYPWTIHETEPLAVHSDPSFESREIGTLDPETMVVGDYFIVKETDEEWLRINYMGDVGWIPRSAVFRPHPTNVENMEKFGNLPYGTEIVNRWWALPSNYQADDLMDVPDKYQANGGRGRKLQLRKEACEQIVKMFDAASAEGIELRVGSPFRAWDTQKSIYDRNVGRAGLKQRFSAPPGHSEHQLGTTTDISFNNGDRWKFLEKDTPEHDWISKNGARFGFRQTYLADNIDETGYVEEPWHWRYFCVEKLEETKAETDPEAAGSR